MIGTSAPVAWMLSARGPYSGPASTANKARGFVVNGEATALTRPHPAPAGRQRLPSVLQP